MLRKLNSTPVKTGTGQCTLDQIFDAAVQRCGSASALARKLGTSHNSICRYVNGETKPSFDDVKRMLPRADQELQDGLILYLTSDTNVRVQIRRELPPAPGDMTSDMLRGMSMTCSAAEAVKHAEDDGIISPEEAVRLLAILGPIQSVIDCVTLRIQQASQLGRPTRRASLSSFSGSCVGGGVL